MRAMALALLLVVSGCSAQGYVRADAIAPTVRAIRERHDAYVLADPHYGETPSGKAQQDSDLRDTELLEQLLTEAMNPKKAPPTK